MHLIRILQISDILAGAPGVSAGQIINELTNWLDEKTEGDRLDVVDYIIVCGNVTADGRPESFEIARQLLSELGNKLLVKDLVPNERWTKETLFNRMLVVPGRADIPIVHNENGKQDSGDNALSLYPDFKPFKDFHDRLFSDELNGRVSPFEVDSAIYRPLKDLTLIGGTYWDVENGILRRKLLEIFEKEITGVTEQLSEFEYLNDSPKILITAAYPLYNLDVRDIYRRIREFLRDKLKISLHLFGSGTVVGVLPEPYSLPHIGLGTGPRSPEGFWPFRANLIEMYVGGGEALSPGSPLISNYVFRRRLEDTKFERSDHIRGQLDLFLSRRHETSSKESVFDSFVKKIELAIFDEEKKFILISGLPGSGKRDLFRLLQQQTQLGKHDVKVVSVVLESYDRQALRAVLAKAERDIDGDPQLPDKHGVIRVRDRRDAILIVRDLYYYQVGNRKAEVAEFLNEDTINRLFMFGEQGPRIKAIIYLVSASNPDIQLEPMIPRYRMERLVLSSLPINAIKLLVKQYSRDAPVIEFDLDTVTGGYAGFSRLLLDATKEAFDYVAGAEPISAVTSAQLMEQALDSSQKLKDEAELYLRVIESRHGGATLREYIQNEIRNIKKKPGSEGVDPGKRRRPLEVSVSVKKLKRAIKKTERKGVETTLDQFVSMGVLEKDRNNDDLYKVRVVMPFLIGSRQPPPGITDEVPPIEGLRTKEDSPMMHTTQVDFLIVTALSEEREAVLKLLPGAQKLDATEDVYTYHRARVPVKTEQGTNGSYNVIVMSYLGMGRVQASAATAHAIHRWQPRCVLLVGIAGGFAKYDVQIGDILIAEQIIDYSLQKLKEGEDEIRWMTYQTDEQMRSFAKNLRPSEYEELLPKTRPSEGTPTVRFGNIASGDKVDARGETITKFGQTWPNLIGIEMEAGGAAVAALQAAYKPKFFMVRCVSDLADNRKDTVGNWWQYACDVAAAFAIALLKRGPLKLTIGVEINAAQPASNDQTFTDSLVTQSLPRGEAQVTERVPEQKQEMLSSKDVSTLADLVDRSGRAEPDSRATLCFNINLDPNELYFLRIPKNIDFATQLVAWLQRTGNNDSLLALCDIVAKTLHGPYAEQLERIRQGFKPSSAVA